MADGEVASGRAWPCSAARGLLFRLLVEVELGSEMATVRASRLLRNSEAGHSEAPKAPRNPSHSLVFIEERFLAEFTPALPGLGMTNWDIISAACSGPVGWTRFSRGVGYFWRPSRDGVAARRGSTSVGTTAAPLPGLRGEQRRQDPATRLGTPAGATHAARALLVRGLRTKTVGVNSSPPRRPQKPKRKKVPPPPPQRKKTVENQQRIYTETSPARCRRCRWPLERAAALANPPRRVGAVRGAGQREAAATAAPTPTPMANHFPARLMRFQKPPPRAAWSAASRWVVSAASWTRSSRRSARAASS